MSRHQEIEYRDEPYSLRDRILAAVLVLVMLAGAWQAVRAWTPWSELELPKGWTAFREGRTTLAIEKQMDQRLPARDGIIAVANSLRWLLLRGGGTDVVVGRKEWLFLSEEFRADPGSAPAMQARLDLLRDASRALQAQGVQLLVALVPDKARLYPSLPLPAGYPDYAQPRYRRALDGLQERGVESVDLFTPMAQTPSPDIPLYYRTDTHWSQAGARVAATAVAARVRELGGCPGDKAYATRDVGPEAERPGDLLRMMGLADSRGLPRPTPDREAPQVTEATGTASDDGAGLFGDVTVPVVLAGTSFSMRGNFHGALQEATSCEVLNVARDGAGFLQSMASYLKDDAFKTARPALIVWEIPERFLTLPLEDEAGWLRDVGLQ